MQYEAYTVDRLGKKIGLKADYLIFLLSKWSYEGIDQTELEQIWLLTEDLFKRVKRGTVSGLSNFLLSQIYRNLKKIVPNSKPRNGNSMVPFIFPGLEKFFLNSFEYFGKKGNNWLAEARQVFSYRISEKSKYPAQRFIGVGYKDKGTLPNQVTNGDPHWKEVAMDQNYQNSVEKLSSLVQFDPLDPEKLLLNEQIFQSGSRAIVL